MENTKTSFLERVKKVLLLDQGVYKEVRDDKDALLQGVIILFATGFLVALGGIIASHIPVPIIQENFEPVFGWFDLIIIPLFNILMWPIISLIIHVPAKLLGGKASYSGFLKSIAFTDIPAAISVIPVIGVLIGFVWVVICEIIAIKATYELSWVKTAAVVILSIILLVILLVLLFIFLAIIGMIFYYTTGTL